MSLASKLALRFLLISGAVIVLSFVIAMTMAVITRRHAEAFLEELIKMRVGETSAAEVTSLAVRYKHFATDQCSPPDLCFEFDNTWLYPVHFGRPSKWQAGLRIGSGRLVDMGFGYVTGATEGTECSVSLNEFDVDKQQPIEIHNRRDGSGRPWKSIVHLGRNADEEKRKRLYEVDLSCLTKIGGCRDSQQLAPRIWAQE